MRNFKQVIVMRKDLKMRRGKECSQAAHASISFLTHRLEFKERVGVTNYFYELGLSDAESNWIEGGFTKICLQIDSEQGLRDIHQKALDAGLNSHLIIDAGNTEFNGVPTPTCLAIGPDYEDKIDPITGHLKLY